MERNRREKEQFAALLGLGFRKAIAVFAKKHNITRVWEHEFKISFKFVDNENMFFEFTKGDKSRGYNWVIGDQEELKNIQDDVAFHSLKDEIVIDWPRMKKKLEYLERNCGADFSTPQDLGELHMKLNGVETLYDITKAYEEWMLDESYRASEEQ